MRTASFSPDGRQLVTGNVGNLYRWDVETGELLAERKTGEDSPSRMVYRTETRLIGGCKSFQHYDVETLMRKANEPRYKGQKRLPNALALAPDGQSLYSAGGSSYTHDDSFLRRWKVAQSGKPVAKVALAPKVAVTTLCVGPRGDWVATGGDDMCLRLHGAGDLACLDNVALVPKSAHAYPALRSLCTDGTSLAVADEQGRVFLAPVEQLSAVREISPPTPKRGRPLTRAFSTGLCFAPGNKLIIPRVYAYSDGDVGFFQIYDVETQSVVAHYEAEFTRVSMALICPNKHWYLALCRYGARLWHLADILGE